MFKESELVFLRKTYEWPINKRWKVGLASFISRKRATKSIMRWHIAPIAKVTMKKPSNNKCCEDVEKLEPSHMCWECEMV